MEIRRNGFMCFAFVVYGVIILYAIICTASTLGAGQEYPYYLKGIFLLSLLCLGTLLLLFGVLWARLGMTRRLEKYPHFTFWAEWGLAAVVLYASALMRVFYVRAMPMDPQSDYKTYYEIAQMLNHGTLLTNGVGYCDYIAMFPHVLGYPLVLSAVFSVFGASLKAAQNFNIVLAVGAVFVVWRIARRMAGRIGGFISLCAAAFWPSQILYGNFVASEYLFTFLLLCCVWLFAASMEDFDASARHPWYCFLELAGMGALLAFAGTIRPMAILFLLSAVIVLLRGQLMLPARLKNYIPLGLRLISRGWKRCLVVLCAYFFLSVLFSMRVGYMVNRTPASGSTSFGYNLLVGLNLQSDGGWNQEDADMLYDSFDSTGSATEAHLTCRDLALKRLTQNPKATFNLMVHKFEVLWGNDDYGASWNILFMDQQNRLTSWRKAFLYRMMSVSDLYYLLMLSLAGVLEIYLWRKKPGVSYSLVLLFLGTAALHLLVENQNRYHYHILPVLAIFAGMAVSYINQECYDRVMAAEVRKEQKAQEQRRREAHVIELAKEEQRLIRLRQKSMHTQFDIEKALREGHVGITVSAAAVTPKSPESPAGSESSKSKNEKKRQTDAEE
ncbi:MAG: glycosyltransferase family 39 protein [Oscillospiraceae bacterium]|jgi:hypothetical protein|nr:glycosyltransferase family 39 protein [Oscillospiraceae bacterium]